MTCDACGKPITASTRREVCQTRRSNPRMLCSVLWTCADCAPQLGAKTPAEWQAYADANGHEYEG